MATNKLPPNNRSENSEGGQNTVLTISPDEIQGYAIAHYVSVLRDSHTRFDAPEAFYVILGIYNLYFSMDGEDELLLIVHDAMRSRSFDRQKIIDAVNEVDQHDYVSPFILYFEEHRVCRNKLIGELILYLQETGRSCSGSDIAAWLTYAAKRALLVGELPLSDSRLQPPFSPCFNDIDAGLSEHPIFKHLIDGPEIKRQETEQPESPREQLISELLDYTGNIGFFFNWKDMSEWLDFTAERTLLIEVPCSPDPCLQPLFHPCFRDIDIALSRHPYFGPIVGQVETARTKVQAA